MQRGHPMGCPPPPWVAATPRVPAMKWVAGHESRRSSHINYVAQSVFQYDDESAHQVAEI